MLNKRNGLLFFSLNIFFCRLLVPKDPFELNDSIMKVIKKIDGMLVVGKDVALMQFVRRGVWEILEGVQTRLQNKRVGKYMLEGKYYSLKDLAIVEQRVNARLSLTQLTSSQKEEAERVQRGLKKCLDQAKADFISTTASFLGQINQLKEFIVPILSEWAQKRGRTDSVLLEWSKTNQGEVEIFNNKIKDCNSLIQFGEDLEDFLAVFIHNCPRAYEQFKQKYLPK